MKKVVALLVVGCFMVLGAAAQDDNLLYGNEAIQTNPDGTGILPSGTPGVGALVQLILIGDGPELSPPVYGVGATAADRDGLTGNDALLQSNAVGNGADAGFISGFDTFPNLGIDPASSPVAVRVFDRASSNGAGNLPLPMVYDDPTLLALYPAAAAQGAIWLGRPGMLGAFYFDGLAQAANGAPIGGGFFSYTVPAGTPGELNGNWQFLPAVPEPTTMTMLGLGGLALLIRRWRRK